MIKDRNYYDTVFKKDGTVRRYYDCVINEFRFYVKTEKAHKFHPKKWNKRGRNYKLSDCDYYRILDICKLFGVKYEKGNDAPRGGVEGDYILVKFDKRNSFIKSLDC